MADVFKLLCPYQLRWLRDRSPLCIAEKSRRIGWTWTEALGAVLDSVDGDKGDYWISSVDATATEEFIGYCEDWAGMVEAVARKTDVEDEVRDEQTGEMVKVKRKVLTFGNGIRISAGSSNPRFFRSKGGRAAWDEAAHHDRGNEMFKAAHATAMFWEYPLHIWSTHNGEDSYFNFLLKEARAGRLQASVHKVSILDAIDQGIVERIIMRKKKLSDIPAPDAKARQEWLDRMRGTCPDSDTWDEEYMCIPSGAGRSFLPADLIRTCTVDNLQVLEELTREWDTMAGPLYAGYDIGRTHDLAVIDVCQRVGDVLWERCLLRLKDVSYPSQMRIIDRLMSNRNLQRMTVDAGMMGAPMVELLQEKYGKYRIEGVLLNESMQAELALPLRQCYEDRSIRIANIPEREAALRKPKKRYVGKNLRLDTPRDKDGHCDEFVAQYLMVAAADLRKAPLPAPVGKPRGW